jgi:sugar phosphate isomerase/epimerase
MRLKIFKTFWGFTGDHEALVACAVEQGYDGVEAPAPEDDRQRERFAQALKQSGLSYIAEICTAGSFVPDRRATPQMHLDSLAQKLESSVEFSPLFVTSLAGCDAWPEEQSMRFFEQAMALADDHHIDINFETHRSRSFFNPWVTARIASALPQLRLTADFSHWCVVCERLMDTEIDVIRTLAPRVRHIHARVGYDQGAQVPHPAAPEYSAALKAHQCWWQMIWQSQKDAGVSVTTMTPEFGPDGYLHQLPFTGAPVADLEEINLWMAGTERQQFSAFLNKNAVED